MLKKSKNSQLVTKADLKSLATRTELKRVEKSLRGEMLRVEEKVENLDEKVDKKLDNVMIKLDGIAKGLDDLRTENVVDADQTRELRVQVDDHETRITKLESPQTA